MAQTDFTIRAPGGSRPFADPLYWLNMTPPDRVPVRERLMLPQVATRVLASPVAKRSGLTTWVGTAVELNTRSNEASDSALILAPSLQYRRDTRRLNFNMQYAGELAVPIGSNPRDFKVRSHGGAIRASYALDPRRRLSVFSTFSDTRDVGDQPVGGMLIDGTRVFSNTFNLGYQFSPSRRSLLDLNYTNGLQIVEGSNNIDIVENRIAVQYQYALSEVASVTGYGDLARFKFGASLDETLVNAGGTYTRDLGPRMSAVGTLGVLHTSGRGGHALLDFGARVTHTDRFARYTLSLERDLVAVAGLAGLARSDQLRGEALMRLQPGLIFEVGMGLERFNAYDALGTKISSATADMRVSYALHDDTWLWAGVEMSGERSGGATSTDHSVIFGISKRFDN